MEPPIEEPATAPRPLPHTWEEARALAYGVAQPLPAHDVPLAQAAGRKLAADVHSLHAMPHYASSAMDGWAVAGSPPWILAEPGRRLSPGQAVPVVTGGLIPAGAKAVLRSESGTLSTDDDGLPVLVRNGAARPGEPKNGQHIRPAGQEAAAGELLVKAGVRLNPAHLALAALGGLDFLSVLGRPAVSLVLTGDEVVSSGIPDPGHVRDAFSPQLGGVVEALGGSVVGLQRAGDSLPSMLDALADFDDDPADVVITTGATGHSRVDFLRPALRQMGATLHIDGIAMRPGHPTLLAELPDGRFVVGLPGNPLAAMTSLISIGAPLLARLASLPMPATVEVVCGSPVKEYHGPTRLMPYRLLYGLASPCAFTDSAMMRGLAAADGIMVVPPHGAKMGETLTAFGLPWA
ncbi:molybdopterin molybdotransferase [Arthrobacter silviterrae]|uniref:molybdopterin molybdotransferase MoeA n=1 Tax=Arthrobacter TaxID=1663 RepID=UPI0021CD5CAB|nr:MULTISPECIES: molybdopterin molybdotransferase MoeA [Arthrobacter]MCU6480838.1 molybdopterin molybdotransferase MoeA [Arthrobacter sp. A2-55]MDQ0278970.1 molybdopterin molybdotransferase [Arthrobacter silviterrae]